jgi:hypothetical protein
MPKYGWVPKRHDHELLYFSDYVTTGDVVIPTPPTSVDWTPRVPASSLSILGNDDAGDCVEAGEYHALQSLTADRIEPTTQQAIGLYSTLTGYDPNNPNTDQGTDIPTALDWWMTNELPGTDSQLGAYFSVDTNDQAQQALALQLGGVLLIGFNCPQSAETQFDLGMEWTPVRHSPITGGHCITVDEIDTLKGTGITWGKYQTFSWPFWQQYVSESYVLFAEDWLLPDGTAPNGILWSVMNTDIQSLYGKPGPFVDPTGGPPPVVTPPPVSSYTPAQAISAIQGIINSTAD